MKEKSPSARRRRLCIGATLLLLWTVPALAGDGAGSAGLLEQLGDTVAEWVDSLLGLLGDDGTVNGFGFDIEPNG